MKYIYLLIAIFFFTHTYAQETYGLIPRGTTSISPKCANCINTLNDLPSEVRFGVRVDESDQMYFEMSDLDWFNQLFKKSTDGIAIDLISKSDFNCNGKNTPYSSNVARGKLLAPLYQEEMKKRMETLEDGSVRVKLGKIPKEFIGKEYELNLLLLAKRNVCHYTIFYNIKHYKWGLLDMGLFTDTIISNQKTVDHSESTTSTAYQNKKLQFVIPFEKNKSNYTKQDIQPLYDSMSLNLYDIKRIDIRAYSSVEGSKANNIKLQEARAKSIVDALQAFQNKAIEYNISSAENWVEFYGDIKGTEFVSLENSSKEAIKGKLLNKDFSAQMEPILAKHRKGVVLIEIEKKTSFTTLSEDQIVQEFNKSVKNKDLETAKDLMNSAFQRIVDGESPEKFLSRLEVPSQQEYGLLKNRKTVLQYFTNERDLLTTYESFLKLKKLQPKSKEVNYNVVALKFQLWLTGAKKVNSYNFQKEIKALARYGVASQLINRMLINYNIILSEINFVKKDYEAKDKNLKSISSKYKYINPNAQDLLKLAQYFVAYGRYDLATRIIKPYIGKVDIDEDLLFYYINLTVIDNELVESRTYKKVLLNAIDVNEVRFCQLFNSFLDGGISFQLLNLPALKENYCESCN